MTLVLEKTWEMKKVITPSMSAALDTAKQGILDLKNTLIGFTNNPWTVWGSSDSVAVGNNDAVDRWVDYLDVVPNAINHSWIVLEAGAGMPGNFSLCIDMNDNAGADEGTLVVSPGAGFGAVNGGTDGTISARPTATDESVIRSVANIQPNAINGRSLVMHVWHATDGTATRLIWSNTVVVNMYLTFEVPKNPLSTWTNPVTWAININNLTNVLLNAQWRNSQRHWLRYGGANYLMYAGMSQSTGSAPTSNESYGMPMLYDAAKMVLPQWLMSQVTPPVIGTLGSLYDIYYVGGWADSQLMAATVGGDPEWCAIGECLLPWDVSVFGHPRWMY